MRWGRRLLSGSGWWVCVLVQLFDVFVRSRFPPLVLVLLLEAWGM